MPVRPREALSFSIITPAYNNPDEVRKLLDSVRPEVLKDPALEMIVVDDCSPSDSVGKVTAASGFARYLKLEKNSGPAAARNAGAGISKNNFLVFVDSDVIFNDDTLSRIREKFAADDSVRIFGGEYDLEPANPSLSTRFKSLMVASWRPSGSTVSVFLTRLGVIEKYIFNKMGGFDTGLKTASVEDYEFARRLLDKGYMIHYDPEVTAKHHFPGFAKQVRLFFHRSFMWMYVFRKYGKFDNTCTTPLLALSNMCGFLSVLLFVASILNFRLIYATLFFITAFVMTNSRFFALTLKHEGLIFTIRAVFMALVISCSIVLGGAWGVIYYFAYTSVLKKWIK